jgi:hypothetical protein
LIFGGFFVSSWHSRFSFLSLSLWKFFRANFRVTLANHFSFKKNATAKLDSSQFEMQENSDMLQFKCILIFLETNGDCRLGAEKK